MKEKSGIEEEINFRKVLQNPIRWFGLIYPYFIIIIIVCGIFYSNNIETAFRNTVQPGMSDTLKRGAEIQKVKGAVSKGIDISAITNPSDEILAKGKQLYNTMCGLCHGEKGEGNGAAGAILNPPPRNFHAETGWKNSRGFTGMYKTLQEGIPNSGMTAYEYLPAEDKVSMIHYIRTFTSFPEITEAEIQQLESNYSISKGQSTPSQIPITEAMEKLSEESLQEIQKVYSMLSYINNHPDEKGVLIFKRVAKDRIKVLSSMNQSDILKSNLDDFVRSIIRTADKAGFNPDVVNLTRDEWNELYKLMNLLNQTGSV